MAKLIGTDPNQVPTNADLGTMAYQDSTNTVLENAYINAKGADGLEMGRDYTSPNNSSRLFFNSNVSGGNWTIFNNSGSLKIQSGAEAGSTSGNYTSVALSTTGAVLGGTVQKPNQPAFLVMRSGQQSNIAVGNHVDVDFNNEIFDVGGNFSSGTFTAPIGRKYLLSYAIYLTGVDTGSGYYESSIVTSNRTIRNAYDPNFSGDLDYWILNYCQVHDMDAGDTAKVTLKQASGSQQTDIDGNSTFSGFLIG